MKFAGLNSLAEQVHQTAIAKGWWDQEHSFATQAANYHGEVSEAWEEWRKGKKMDEVYYKHVDDGTLCDFEACDRPLKPEGIPIELADILIRVLDTCAAYDIDIEAAFAEKAEYNETRSYRHGGKRA